MCLKSYNFTQFKSQLETKTHWIKMVSITHFKSLLRGLERVWTKLAKMSASFLIKHWIACTLFKASHGISRNRLFSVSFGRCFWQIWQRCQQYVSWHIWTDAWFWTTLFYILEHVISWLISTFKSRIWWGISWDIMLISWLISLRNFL